MLNIKGASNNMAKDCILAVVFTKLKESLVRFPSTSIKICMTITFETRFTHSIEKTWNIV